MSTKPFSKPAAALVKRHRGLAFVSGHVGVDEHWLPVTGSFKDEAHQVFRNLRATLVAESMTLRDVQHVRTYLGDLSDFEEFNEVWGEYFDENPPARTTVGAQLVAPFRIECEAIAAID